MKYIPLILFLPFLFSTSYAQYNNIRDSDILYKKRIVRSINLRNSVNEELFGKDNSMVQILLEAYERGELTGYKKDDLKEILSYADYKEKLRVEVAEGDTISYTSNELYKIEIGEDLIFDSRRSEIVFDIESITLFIPERVNRRGLLEPVISFSYDDCQKIFKMDQRSYSVNPLLNGKNINYSEVFLLRLFASDIVKIGNDNYFDQMYSDPTQAFVARKEAENTLTEYLYKLYNPK